jgi:hypothetical protein
MDPTKDTEPPDEAADTIPPSMAPIPAGEARQRMADAIAGAREAFARVERVAMGIAAGLDASAPRGES